MKKKASTRVRTRDFQVRYSLTQQLRNATLHAECM